MKAMIAMRIDCGRKELQLIWTGELSTGGCQEPNAISSGALERYNACQCDV